MIVVSIDTLRADHLPAYGYRGVDTPHLDALAKDSVVFDNAVAHVPLTLPSHVSLWTGLLPFQHGVRDNVGYRMAGKHPTLAGFLRALGYATGGAVSAFVLDHGSGVAEGFEYYEDGIESRDVAEALGRVQRAGGETEALLEHWIARQTPGRPLFAFLHLYEPHSPYDPSEPFRTKYAGRPYDGEIATADAIVGRFLAFTRTRGIYDRAVVILLSDHGEGLGEHGEDEHGILLYRETLRVPLFVKLPRSRDAGRRVSAPAGLADVFPTVAALLGEKAPEGLSGLPLLERGGSERARSVYSETLYPRYHFGWSDLASLTDARYHYIAAPRAELFDWTSDPSEKTNLASGLPPAFRSLRLALEKMDRPLQPPGSADPETVRKLASLGYIGAAAPATHRKDLPDPKDRISTLGRLKDATRLASEHRDDAAVALLRTVVRENPLLLDGWETLARLLRGSGRPREAIAALEEADRLSPATAPILLGLADLHRETGNLQKAWSLAQAAGAAGGAGVPGELAEIALARKDLAEAARQAEAALAGSETSRAPLLTLARIEQARGNPDGALRQLDRALGVQLRWKQGPMRNLQALRGDALARLGREREAEAAFREEIEAFPGNLDAWSRLAVLFAGGGREAEFRGLLEEMTRRVGSRQALETAGRLCRIVGDRWCAKHWGAKLKEVATAAGS
ncbi:MAG: sulfatase-like hydrolase/transferase [Acidobacteria bacterium]|nr:sulfatase-like hydrolase/transferase [Acidobacteriota bacterium]MCA1611007.1 sulfatase-like hydrolase/transferase [Acidobacteriota bacterium]